MVSSIREVTPGVTYEEIKNEKGWGDNGSGLNLYFDMLESEDLDILICDASLVPLPLSRDFRISAILDRANPFNVFISESASIFEDYPGEMPIEVFSPVIKGQLIYHHPAFSYVDCDRDFSLCYQRMLEEKCGGFVLPAFVVETLNQQGKVVEVFNSSVCMPPPGQGGLAMVTRSVDSRTGELAAKLNNHNAYLAVSLEREFAGEISRGDRCVGALCSISGFALDFSAVVVSPDGSDRIERTVSGNTEDGNNIVRQLVEQISSAGTGAGS
ncbi:MAG: hypothetical protein GF417_11520 [Candidatus Latescibacteria bacterium]|nr:hypothetical protein [bacterium]MBD3425053.1 hypothetical protein [Candidatus Latescibacterota bacterium]